MKKTINLLLAITLFCSVALADGNQGSGTRNECTPETCPPPPPCTENCGNSMIQFGGENDGVILTIITELAEVMADSAYIAN